MAVKELLKKVGIELWWIFKRDSWVVAVTAILFGIYASVVPSQNLIKFLEKGCLQYLILIPLPILAIIIYSHICALGQKKYKPDAPRRKIQFLYVVGVLAILIAHVITIRVFAMSLFFKIPEMPINPTLDFWEFIDVIYGVIFTPALDWFIFRFVIPKAFSDEKKDMKEKWFCRIVSIPGRNMVASALVFFFMVVIIEIIC